MKTLDLAYPSEKLHAARRMLMAPHPRGDAEAFARAFFECDICKKQLDQVDDEQAREWIKTIRKTMDTTGLEDPNKIGLHAVKAARLTDEEKWAFADAVDELSSWLDREFWASSWPVKAVENP